MSRRPPLPRCLRTVAAFALALPFAATAATIACADSPPESFALSIASGVMRDGKESRIEVRAHADGCVAVYRPWFLREAGDYELRLGAKEWADLQNAVAPEQLRKIDPQRLSTQTGTVWKDASATPVVYADPDADVYTLRWHEGSTLRQLVARNPRQASERLPKASEVNRFASAVDALRALASRADKRAVAEQRP
jgi:hypothetical protein